MKKTILLFAAGALAMVCLGLATGQIYRGTFVGSFTGNGANITNLAPGGITVPIMPPSANLTNWSALATGAKQPSSLVLSNLSLKNGGDLTNVTSTLTDWTGSDSKANATNASIVDSLAVTGLTGDGIRLAVRRKSGQTNDIFQVQTEGNAALFSVETGGIPRTSTYRATSTNAFVIPAYDGGSWIIHVANDGTLSAVTNAGGL